MVVLIVEYDEFAANGFTLVVSDPNPFSFCATCFVFVTATDALVRTFRYHDINIAIWYTYISLKRPLSYHRRLQSHLSQPTRATYSVQKGRSLYSSGSTNFDLCSFRAVILGPPYLGTNTDRIFDKHPVVLKVTVG